MQFGQLGAAFSRVRFGIDNPRVGLLSIGEEETKGTPLVKETHKLLKTTPGINFIGNVEGRDILTDDVDVVVTDGFTGNVALKTLEGAMKFLIGKVFEAIMSERRNQGGRQRVAARRWLRRPTSSTPTPPAAPRCSGSRAWR